MTNEIALLEGPAAGSAPEREGNLLKRVVLADRTARWTSRLVLLLLWQLAGSLFNRIPTPLQTWDFVSSEWARAHGRGDWSVFNNELAFNVLESIRRAGLALLVVLLIGIVLGYAMGRFWRIQAFFTDLVIVGIALPAFIWALLAVMWFGLQGMAAPVFVCFVSATPMLVVNVFQGSLAVPRELRDMSDAYDVPFRYQARHLVLPSMAGFITAGFRVAVLAGWGAVMLVEWFGNVAGAGYRARYWYDASNFSGLMGWGVIILAFVITVDRMVLERLIRRAHRWRAGIGGMGAARPKAPVALPGETPLTIPD